MSIPTFNKFKSTTVYGAFNNLDYEDNTVQASSNIQRNLTVGGDIVVATGNIKGKKLFYNNVDIASTYVTNTTLTSYASLFQPQFKGNIDITVIDPILNPYTFSIANGAGNINMTTYNNGSYTIKINASNLQLSKNNGTNYYDILTTNTGALKSGATFTGNVSGLTAITTDNSTKFATTAFVKDQNYITSSALSPCALLTGATFTGDVSIPNKLSVRQTSPTSPAVLEFATDTGDPSAYIYASFISNVFRFDILPSCSNGFEWSLSGDSLMQLDTNGNLSINGSLSSSITTLRNPLPSPSPRVMLVSTGRYETEVAGLTNDTITQNDISIISIGLIGGTQSITPLQFTNIRYIPNGTSTGQNTNIIVIAPFYGTVLTAPVVFVNANVYDTNGAPVRGYITLRQNHDSNPKPYSIVFVSYTTLNYNSTYTMDPFQFTYMYN